MARLKDLILNRHVAPLHSSPVSALLELWDYSLTRSLLLREIGQHIYGSQQAGEGRNGPAANTFQW